MHNFELHPEFYNHPILLTEEEQKKAFTKYQRVFENISLL